MTRACAGSSTSWKLSLPSNEWARPAWSRFSAIPAPAHCAIKEVEMTRYGKVETGFWHSKKIRRLSQNATFLMLYLLSCPHSNAVGCFVLLDGYVAADVRWSPEA